MITVATPRVQRATKLVVTTGLVPAATSPCRRARKRPGAEHGEVGATGPNGFGSGRPLGGWRRWRSGVVATATDLSPEGNVCSPNRSKRRPIDHLVSIEDIAMTSAVLILALSGVGLGHHYASPQAPSK